MTLVRGGDGMPLLCCWDDCARYGHVENGYQWPEDRHAKGRIYIFCSPRHKELYINAPRDNQNLPVGLRGLAVPR